ncbi:hypothetical protein OQA88_8575 [Cercophora sp. LCS_1]
MSNFQAIHERISLKTESELEAYSEWLRSAAKSTAPEQLTAKEFANIIDSDSSKLTNRTFLLPLIRRMMRYTPRLPIGATRYHIYRLVVDPYQLLPSNLDEGDHVFGSGPLIDTPILCVNTSIQPRKPAGPLRCRDPNLPEVSKRVVQFDSRDDTPGFIFQLGELQSALHGREDEWTPRKAASMASSFADSDTKYHWHSTGFILVARLRPDGKLNGIYGIYNMTPEDDSDNNVQITHDHWGMPPAEPGEKRLQFSMARIGDTLGGLGYDQLMDWSDRTLHPVELVRVMPANNQLRCVRLTVA